jgi:hypothetical protein
MVIVFQVDIFNLYFSRLIIPAPILCATYQHLRYDKRVQCIMNNLVSGNMLDTRQTSSSCRNCIPSITVSRLSALYYPPFDEHV